MSLGRLAVISAIAVIVAWVGGMLVAELGILILSVPFFALMTAGTWALVILVLLAAFRRWGRSSDGSSRPSRSSSR